MHLSRELDFHSSQIEKQNYAHVSDFSLIRVNPLQFNC